MQHTEDIQISLQISRKRLGLGKEMTPYWENIQRFFGRPSFTSTRVWGKVKALCLSAVWISRRVFNTDEANYILYLYPPLLLWNESKNEKKNPKLTTQSSLRSWSCQPCWVSRILFPHDVVCSKIPSVVTMGHKTFKCICWEGQEAELFSMRHDFILNIYSYKGHKCITTQWCAASDLRVQGVGANHKNFCPVWT